MNYVSFKINVDTNSFDYCTDNNIEIFSLLKNPLKRVNFDGNKVDAEKYFVVVDGGRATGDWTYNPNGNILLFDVLERELKNDSKFSLVYKDLLERKCSILFYFREQTLINTNEFYDQLNKTINLLNIDKDQLMFFIIEFYNTGLRNKNYQILSTPFHGFNMGWWDMDRIKKIKEFYDLYSEYSSYFLKQKHFTCTNNRIKHSRSWVTYTLFENNLLDKGYVSYLANNNDPENQYDFDDFLLDMKHSQGKDSRYIFSDEKNRELKEFYDLLPIECDTDDNIKVDTHLSHLAIQGVVLNSYFNIITESSGDGSKNKHGRIFFTEKIWKPIVAKQPFILISDLGYLEALNQIGFKTFEPFVDESYDKLIGVDKYKKIESEIIRLCNMTKTEIHEWYWNLNDILDFNSDFFMKMLLNSVGEITKFINNNRDGRNRI